MSGCYTIDGNGRRVAWSTLAIGGEARIIEKSTGNRGLVCRVEEYREAWEDGPLWPVLSHPSWPQPAMLNPAWLRAVKAARKIELPDFLR